MEIDEQLVRELLDLRDQLQRMMRLERPQVVGGGVGVPTTRQVIAGAGLSGGGNLATDVTLHVNAGDGIQIASDAVAVDSTVVRSSRSIIAGAGLSGGGSLAADVTLHVNAGDGIQIASDAVAVDSTVVRSSRSINTNAPLTGGGDLSTSRTLALNADGHFQMSNNALSLRKDPRPGNRLLLLLEHGLRVNTEYITGVVSVGGGVSLQVNETFDPGTGVKTAGVLSGSIFFASPSGLQLAGNGLAVRVSPDPGNVLQLRSNGVYVPSALTGQIQVVAAGAVTLQPALSEGEYLYSNTRVTLSPPQADANYTVMLSPMGAPAMTFVDDVATDGFTLWALVDTRLTAQSVTPTIAWFVVRW